MSNDIKIGINISDNGTGAKVVGIAQQLKNVFDDVVKSASRIPQAVMAAREGVTASNTSKGYIRPPSKSAKMPEKFNQEGQDYATARGIAGTTGAASRDFAKQAQGLGGLVHVYATFAANLFAVSAAFSALSKAADTTNMVKGLNQLGASSGRALGSLAKQLSEVTDGAISMRDAMTATVSASAGGMTNAAILRMGVVAKQASQALGISMPDAISRLSRGITKLEPELLDELGIMVRVDTASQDYARTLGKTASALTDFEKRQGFANAVLEQGEKKFGAIKIDTNPYDKILASMKNLAQVGLELVNKVLGPLINLLASSPTALSTVMAGIGIMLLKQAIPAIGMFRENARRMSDETTARVKRQVDEQRDAAIQLDIIAAKRAETDYLTTASGLKKVQALKDASFNSKILGADVRGALKKNPLDLTPEESGKILSKHKELQDKISSGTATKGENDQYTKLEARAVKLKELNATLSRVGDVAAEVNEKKDSLWWTHQRQKEAYLKKLETEAKKSSIVSSAAENAAVMGPGIAFKTLRADLSSLEGGSISKIGTAVKGTFAIATSAVTTFMNSIGGVLMLVGLVTAAFGLIGSWASSNSKETDKFSSSITGVSDAVDNLKRTLEFIIDKDFTAVFSVESIQARANALQGLSDSLKSLVKDFNAVQRASSWFDKGMDAVWDSIGLGSADKLSTNLANSISAGLAGAANTAAKSDAVKKLQDILGKNIDVTNIEAVNTALRKLSNTEISTAGAAIDRVLRDISLSANNAASTLTAASERIVELSKLVQTQNLALTPTDAVGKLGTAMVSSASDITKSLQDPINSLLLLNKLTKDGRTLSLLSPNVANELITANTEIQKLNDNYGALQQELLRGEKALQDLKNKGIGKDGAQQIKKGGGGLVDTEAAVTAKNYIATIQNSIVEAEAKMKSVSSDLANKVAVDFVNIGLSKLNLSLKAAMSEGGITAARGYLSVLKEAGVGTAAAETRVAQQELGMQKQILQATYNQIKAQQQNTNAIEILTISNQLVSANLALSTAGTSEIRRDKAQVDVDSLEKQLKELVQKVRITEMKPKDALALRAGGEFSASVLAGMAPYMTQLTGYLSGLATIGGKAAAIQIQGFASLEKEKVGKTEKENNTSIASMTAEVKTLDNAIALTAEYDKQLYLDKEALQVKIQKASMQTEMLKYESNLRVIVEASKTGEVKEEEVKKAKQAADNAYNTYLKTQAVELNTRKTENLKIEQKGLEEIRQKQQVNAELLRTETQAINSIKLAQRAEEIKYLENIGALTGAEAAAKQTAISLSQQAIEDEKQRVDIASKYVTSYIALENSKKLVGPQAEKDKFTAQQKLLEDSYLRQITAQDLLNAGKVTSITLAGQQEVLAKSHADQMEKMVSATESLSTTFGDLGNNIGLAGQALLKMAQSDESYLKNKAILQSKIAKEDNTPEEKIGLIKNLADLDKKQTKDELTNISKTAGASKKMFGEKTAAYKVLDGIEKASAAYKFAIQVRELAQDFKNFAIKIGLLEAEVPVVAATTATKTGIELSGQAATMPAKIAGTYASFMSMLGPFGPPAAALAIAAFIGSFALGGGGGASVSIPPGMTSEEAQKTQGTGQSYKREKVDGKSVDKLVENGNGVFGDASAKSKAIVDSLEILKNNSIEGLSYDNKLLTAMEKVASALGAAAMSLYQIPGLRIGSAFETKEGSSGKTLLGWGSTTNKSIIDSGIKLQGTFADLSRVGSGTASIFEKVETTVNSSSWFGLKKSSKTSVNVNNKSLESVNPEAAAAIANVFKNATDMFIEIGASAGIAKTTIEAKLSSLPIDLETSTRGLTGKALEDELNAVIGNALSSGARSIFSQFENYKKFGEDYLTTTIRVVDGSNKVSLALQSIGISAYDTANSLTKYDISETLIKNAGGIEQFLTNIKFFADNFLTEAQRLEPITKSVATSMTKASESSQYSVDLFKTISDGFDGIVNTREEFSKLYSENLKVAAGSGETALAAQTLVTALDKVAPAFLMTVAAAEAAVIKTNGLQKGLLTAQGKDSEVLALNREETLKAKDLTASDALILKATYVQEDLNKTKDLELSLMTLQGKSLEVLNLTRAKELYGLSAANTELVLAKHTQEDYNKTKDLELRFTILQGKSLEALNLTREKELKGLSARDTAMVLAIHAQEDLNVQTTWQNKLSILLGTTTARKLALEKDLASATNEVTKSLIQQVYAQEDLAETTKAQLQQNIAIYELLGDAEKVLQLTRERELDTLDVRLRPLQLYLNALKDEASLKVKLTKAYTDQSAAIKNTISSLIGSIKSLKDYTTSLTAGASSLLTPAEKYAQAKSTMFQTAALARSVITSTSTAEEIATRNDAVSKLSSTSDAFLAASKEMFASSDKYIQDFNSVLNLLDDSSLSLTQQLSTAEKQLVTLDESVSFLKLITTSTDTTSSLLQEMLILQKITEAARLGAIASGVKATSSIYGIPAMAGGGTAKGLTLVGEEGPEVANFTSAARIYSNQASNDIFNTKELVAEIKSLRAEVSQLRADQKQQTGHLIAANYDANSKNATAVVNATEEATATQDWKIRSQVKIA